MSQSQSINLLTRHKLWEKTAKVIALPKNGVGAAPGDIHRSAGFLSMIVDPVCHAEARALFGADVMAWVAPCFQHTRTLVVCLARSQNEHIRGGFTNQVLFVFNVMGKSLMTKRFGNKSRVIQEELEDQLKAMVEQATILPF